MTLTPGHGEIEKAARRRERHGRLLRGRYWRGRAHGLGSSLGALPPALAASVASRGSRHGARPACPDRRSTASASRPCRPSPRPPAARRRGRRWPSARSAFARCDQRRDAQLLFLEHVEIGLEVRLLGLRRGLDVVEALRDRPSPRRPWPAVAAGWRRSAWRCAPSRARRTDRRSAPAADWRRCARARRGRWRSRHRRHRAGRVCRVPGRSGRRSFPAPRRHRSRRACTRAAAAISAAFCLSRSPFMRLDIGLEPGNPVAAERERGFEFCRAGAAVGGFARSRSAPRADGLWAKGCDAASASESRRGRQPSPHQRIANGRSGLKPRNSPNQPPKS